MDKRVQVLKLTARENRTGIATEADIMIDLSELSFVSKSGTFFACRWLLWKFRWFTLVFGSVRCYFLSQSLIAFLFSYASVSSAVLPLLMSMFALACWMRHTFGCRSCWALVFGSVLAHLSDSTTWFSYAAQTMLELSIYLGPCKLACVLD